MAMPDAPVAGGWLLDHVGGRFVVMAVEAELPEGLPETLDMVLVKRDPAKRPGTGTMLADTEGLVAQRYGEGMVYLIRPDQHVAARFWRPTTADVERALARARGRSG